jgi:hypothetical protein
MGYIGTGRVLATQSQPAAAARLAAAA